MSITTTGSIVQLRLELADLPAPAVALWELVGAEQREHAMVLLAALIARTLESDPGRQQAVIASE